MLSHPPHPLTPTTHLRALNPPGRASASSKKECVQALLAVAQQQRYTTGKWLLFLSPDSADEAWATIARCTAEGQLGCSAKISPTAGLLDGEVAVCCVYVTDFAARGEVRRVLQALQGLGMEVRAGFKPDVYTELGIMGSNRWRLEPTLYKVTEVLAWQPPISDLALPQARSSPWGVS